MKNNYYCLILAGGIGSRLWPSSSSERPKQFLDVMGTGETMLQTTFNRYSRLIDRQNIFVTTAVQYAALVAEQLPELPPENILLEDARRNTTTSVSVALQCIVGRNPEACVVVSPSDQKIDERGEAFGSDIAVGLDYVATHKRLLALGVTPTSPDTNYGYIQMKDERLESADIFRVKSFSEKPALEYARMFLESGEFLWNTGLFIFNAMTFMDEVEQIKDENYSLLPQYSLEHVLLERAINMDVLRCHFGWADVGSWTQLYNLRSQQADDNVVLSGSSMLYGCNGCIVKCPEGKLIVAQDLQDYAIIADNGVLMICKKDDQQSIRKFVNDYSLL